jgi:hypothetical protein
MWHATLGIGLWRGYIAMVRTTGPTAHRKKSADATINGSKPVRTQKKKTAPKSKTPTPPPTKNRVRKSVLEQLDAAFQPSTSGKIVLPKHTATRMGSAEQLEMEFILPGNVAKNKNIQDLREKWSCTRPDSVCPSTHCFVQLSGEHLPLSHQHFDTWGSAMVSLSLINFLTQRSANFVCRLVMMVERLWPIPLVIICLIVFHPLFLHVNLVSKMLQHLLPALLLSSTFHLVMIFKF